MIHPAKYFFSKVAIACIAFATALAAAEILLAWLELDPAAVPYRLRLLDPEDGDEGYLQAAVDIPYTTRRGYRGHWSSASCGGCAYHGKGSVTIDDRGFRTSRSDLAPADAVDVLCMGDSFTFGYLVDDLETYPRGLQTLYGPSTVVVNAGYYGGLSFGSAELRFRNDFLAPSSQRAPKVLVYGVFPLNDFSDLAVWMSTDASGRPTKLRSINQVLNEFGDSLPVLRESRLFIGLSRLGSRIAFRDLLEETARLRSQRIAGAIRRFHDDATMTGTRLVFVILREPNGAFERHLAAAEGVTVEEYRKSNDALVDRLEAELDANRIEWYDDAGLIDGLHEALARRRLPEPPGALPIPLEDLEREAASSDWSAESLAAADGVHYSGLTNAYVASWIHEILTDGALTRRRPSATTRR